MVEKPTNEFYNSNSRKDGKQKSCITCQKVYFKAWRASRTEAKAKLVSEAKTCQKCHVEKPISQFGKRAINLDKKNIYCKPCWRDITKRAQRRLTDRKRNG
jgi:hypothetical protein